MNKDRSNLLSSCTFEFDLVGLGFRKLFKKCLEMFLVCHNCSTDVPNCLEKNQNTLWSIKVCVEKQIQQYQLF